MSTLQRFLGLCTCLKEIVHCNLTPSPIHRMQVVVVQHLVCVPALLFELSLTHREEVDSDDEDDDRITMANMERKAKALDRQLEEEAQLDIEEMQQAVEEEDDGDDDEMDEEFDGAFELPSAEEREAERKSGGSDLSAVQRRIQMCARVLSSFKKRAAPGR